MPWAWRRAAIGVVGLAQVMLHGDVLALPAALPDARLDDATAAVDGIMAIRSAEEIALQTETYRLSPWPMRDRKRRSGLGAASAPRWPRPAALAEQGCLDGIAHLTHGAAPLRPPTDRIIGADDVIKVSLEFAGPNGYWVELSAVYSFRPPRRVSCAILKPPCKPSSASRRSCAWRRGPRRYADRGGDLCRSGLAGHRTRLVGWPPDRPERDPAALSG